MDLIPRSQEPEHELKCPHNRLKKLVTAPTILALISMLLCLQSLNVQLVGFQDDGFRMSEAFSGGDYMAVC